MAYVTQNDIETALGKAFTIPASYLKNNNAGLNATIARVSDQIDAFTGSHWELVSRALFLDGDGTDMLSILPVTGWAIQELISVSVRGNHTHDFDTQGSVVPATAYTLHNSRRHIRRADYLPWVYGVKNYRVIAMFGCRETPEAIKHAVTLLVREEMEPGHIDNWMPLYQERFPDGYSYTRSLDTQSGLQATPKGGVTTGNIFIDSMLSAYKKTFPFSAMGM